MTSSKVTDNIYMHKRFVRWSGLFLEVSGVLMIFMDLKSEGTIAIKTPFVDASINATYIGLLVIFMGIILQVVTILKSYGFK